MSESSPHVYDPIVMSDQSTVVAEYAPTDSRCEEYQSEAALEREFIRILESQAYEHLPIHCERDLVVNLRRQLEDLNGFTFSENEWSSFYSTCVASANDSIEDKTVRLQEDEVQLLRRDDGTTKNVKLIDKSNIHNNRLQVINQYQVGTERDGSRYDNRYDVTILVNGLPMVHVELKRRGVAIREAFNQIRRYQRDSFWAGSGLFEYVQLFVISNGTHTKYYSNTTRSQHLKDQRKRSAKKTSNSFEFTSWWADAQNKPIQDLEAFAKTFFAKHTLLNILTKYCVLTVDRMLLVMRPYQIVATERILQRIATSTNYRQLGTVAAGGYIWHTTGSGKTLTSFKTAQLATRMPGIDKVLFVVDRKDLDYQTMREYDRFEKGAANSNASTAILKAQLEDPSAKIIITTIQKLSIFIRNNNHHDVYNKHVVIVFDECHRSQFGDMHTDITRAFKRYHLFGFTGTPIFAANSRSSGNPKLRTTEQTFGDKLHTYTIIDAINDKNVLPFRVDYNNTMRVGSPEDRQVAGIDTEMALMAPERIRQIVQYTLEHFDQKTKRTSSYEHSVVTNVSESTRGRRAAEALRERKRVHGFNAIFATASIDAARRYYNEFQRQQEDLAPDKRLKIAIIYSYGANEATDDDTLDDEAFDTESLSEDSRAFLENAIQDYNDLFGTSYDTTAEKFQNYYKDLSQRLKNREVDLVIVVNMFLTGFDATTLNTLFVDKPLKAHGLLQAFSRTNRILNSVKTYGNIVCFRDLEDATNKALELFGNKDAGGIVLLKPYQHYLKDYTAKVNDLLVQYPLGDPIVGEVAKKKFVKLFGAIIRLENILTSFDEFADDDTLTERQKQDYRSIYLDLWDEFRRVREEESDKEKIDHEDVVFEIELIKQVAINVDYILMLVEEHRKKHCEEHRDGRNAKLTPAISRAIDANPSLRSKKDLIEQFVATMSVDKAVNPQWEQFINNKRDQELDKIIERENLYSDKTHEYMDNVFRDGELQTTGIAITKVMKPISRFGAENNHAEKKARVIKALRAHFDRFRGLGLGEDLGD